MVSNLGILTALALMRYQMFAFSCGLHHSRFKCQRFLLCQYKTNNKLFFLLRKFVLRYPLCFEKLKLLGSDSGFQSTLKVLFAFDVRLVNADDSTVDNRRRLRFRSPIIFCSFRERFGSTGILFRYDVGSEIVSPKTPSLKFVLLRHPQE